MSIKHKFYVHPEVRPLFNQVFDRNRRDYPDVRFSVLWRITYAAIREEMKVSTRALFNRLGILSQDGPPEEEGNLALV